MKKYSSGSFIDAAVRVYGSEADTITSFPASIIANGGNITPWTIYGNTLDDVSAGTHTSNLFYSNINHSTTNNIITVTQTQNSAEFDITKVMSDADNSLTINVNIPLSAGTYTLSEIGLASYGRNLDRIFLRDTNDNYYANNTQLDTPQTFTTETDIIINRIVFVCAAISEYNHEKIKVMLNYGNMANDYEPYGYKLPVVIGSNTTNIYMTDVLRKSTGADPVYDIMSSTGVITRNVDTDGTPLVTPTTESFTAPTIATVAGSQSVSFDTTVKPSKAELTYTGWHTHSDKKRSGGAWT